MARHQTLFPFAPLPDGEVEPQHGPGEAEQLRRRDLQIVRWFIEERWGRIIKAASPLGELLATAAKADLNVSTATIGSLEPEVERHALHAVAQLIRLAWTVRALHGNTGAIDCVDGSFIDDDLLGEDSKEPGTTRKLPGGIGTLVFAGRLVQAGGGRITYISGKGKRGHDIRWVTGGGDTVLVERKDRSYAAGLGDTTEKRARRVVAEVRTAGTAMPSEPGAARVLVVGFQHLVRESEVNGLGRSYDAGLEKAFGGGAVPLDSLPHCVIVEHLGMEPRAGGDKTNFFSPHVLNPEPNFIARMLPLLAKAFGAYP